MSNKWQMTGTDTMQQIFYNISVSMNTPTHLCTFYIRFKTKAKCILL